MGPDHVEIERGRNRPHSFFTNILCEINQGVLVIAPWVGDDSIRLDLRIPGEVSILDFRYVANTRMGYRDYGYLIAASLRQRNDVVDYAAEVGLGVFGLVASPITGPAGNHEFLLGLAGKTDHPAVPIATAIENCLARLD